MSLPNLADLKKIHFLVDEIQLLELKLAKLEQEKVDLDAHYQEKKIAEKVTLRKEIQARKEREITSASLNISHEAEKETMQNFIEKTEHELKAYFKSNNFAQLVGRVIEKAENQGQIKIFVDSEYSSLINSKYITEKSSNWPLAVEVNSKIYDLNPQSLQQLLMPKLATIAFKQA